MKLEIAHADTCLPDYWGGHHLAHLQIPVDGSTTMRELRQAMRDELRQGAIAGNDEIARLLSADMVKPEEEKQADKVTRAAYAAVNRLRLAPGKRKPFPQLDLQPEDSDSQVYAFFVIREF
jgi:hypothetical protein